MSDIRNSVDKILASAFDSLNFPKHPGSLYDPVRYIMDLGGKRFRPRLLLLAAGMCGGKPEDAVSTARAVEMLHNFTLIHDDIMDNAPARRGRPTVHERWNDATAILSGDVLFVMAMQQLASTEEHDGNRGRQPAARMMRRFLDAVQEVCDGQAMDMDFETREMVPLEEYLQMIRAKTGALIRCSMELGAMSAGADDAVVQQCGEIGEHAGLAFQIQDDLLDAVGDTSKFGKKVGGDITEGKKTWLTILALQRADDTDRILLKQILGDKNAKESDVLRIIRVYNDLGVIDDALAAVEEHYYQASQLLAKFEESDYRE
ncbi:MAG: polyprenyl synthetase family protein, partial [Bacteroidota bacterium]